MIERRKDIPGFHCSTRMQITECSHSLSPGLEALRREIRRR
jgi:hypothetical protein